VAIADALLGCEGRLIVARDVIGYGPALLQGPLFSVPLLDERA
jgi:hypothetical protein